MAEIFLRRRPADWAIVAEDAHKAVFNEILLPEYDRIDYALLVIREEPPKEGVPVAYMTLREFDKETVYMKHGGTFDPVRGTVFSMPCYVMMLNWLKETHKRITTLVENTNTVYLKMALSVGFKVIGIRNFRGSVLLELYLGE